MFNFRKVENISLFTTNIYIYITNNTIENTQTINYIDKSYLNNNKTATVIVNPTQPLNENYLWIPEVSDNVVPGLDSLLTYTQSKYATINALQNDINNINITINDEVADTQTEIDKIEITNLQNVSKYLHYHTSHTDSMCQKRNTDHNHDNRRSYTTQQNYFTYQRKGNQELQVQALNIIVADLRNQINNTTYSNPPDNNEPEVGTM